MRYLVEQFCQKKKNTTVQSLCMVKNFFDQSLEKLSILTTLLLKTKEFEGVNNQYRMNFYNVS